MDLAFVIAQAGLWSRRQPGGFGLDPASGSASFVATPADVTGLVTYLRQQTVLSYVNSQEARILLMLALTKTNDLDEIKRIFAEY